MSGFCYSCASRFGTFNRELGCKNCGFAFCKKCLARKTTLPQYNNAKFAVCSKCYDVFTGKTPVTTSAAFEPPDAYFKRMAALENAQSRQPAQRQAQPQVNRHSAAKQSGLSKKDSAIAERLQKLKESTKPANVPSQSEIEARLGRLKQAETASSTSDAGDSAQRQNQPHMLLAGARTQQEQIDSLLNEISDEVEIDARASDRLNQLKYDVSKSDISEPWNDCNKAATSRASQPVDTVNIPTDAACAGHKTDQSDIEALMREVAAEMHIDAQQAIEGLKKDKDLWDHVQRLRKDAATRQGDVNDQHATVDADAAAESDSEDEETATKRIIQQIMAENQLDEQSGLKDIQPIRTRSKKGAVKTSAVISKTEAEAELPWCCICNEDATLRCNGCDGDLYCTRCFREGHDQWEIQEHKTVRYSAPVQSNR